jgi:hypothetical protein
LILQRLPRSPRIFAEKSLFFLKNKSFVLKAFALIQALLFPRESGPSAKSVAVPIVVPARPGATDAAR